MATFIPRSNNNSNKVAHALGLLCVLLLVQNGAAYDFTVGGQKGWSVPSDPNFNPFNQWAEKSRFQVGDSLVFNYESGKDSVLYVKSEDYASCNTASPEAKFSDGHTVFKLNKSGPYYFISGNKDNCLKNEKLTVIVLADRRSNNGNSSSNTNTNQTNTASPPSPTASAAAPSPAPTGQEGQSPPAGTVETNPTPAPTGSNEPHPPNAAPSVFVNFAGSLGALFTASVMILSL